jgi:hypothetical protein
VSYGMWGDRVYVYSSRRACCLVGGARITRFAISDIYANKQLFKELNGSHFVATYLTYLLYVCMIRETARVSRRFQWKDNQGSSRYLFLNNKG